MNTYIYLQIGNREAKFKFYRYKYGITIIQYTVWGILLLEKQLPRLLLYRANENSNSKNSKNKNNNKK